MKVGLFDVAAGTVPGGEHLGEFGGPPTSNNQDAHLIMMVGDSIVTVVCDGCSDRPESGTGATILARLFAAAVEFHLPGLKSGEATPFCRRVQQEVVRRMEHLVHLLHAGDVSSSERAIPIADELLLSTVIGTVITPDITIIMAAGDGVWSVNSTPLNVVGPFPGNAPPYLGYLIRGNPPSIPSLEVLFEGRTSEVDRVLIGSDGCNDIPQSTLHRVYDQQTFDNRETLNRILRKLNTQTVSLEGESETLSYRVKTKWTERPLRDDTTLIVVRRTPMPVVAQRSQSLVQSRPPGRSNRPRAATEPHDDDEPWLRTLLSRRRGKGE